MMPHSLGSTPANRKQSNEQRWLPLERRAVAGQRKAALECQKQCDRKTVCRSRAAQVAWQRETQNVVSMLPLV
eukprot:583913-Pyramimonas_sp.AAC.1